MPCTLTWGLQPILRDGIKLHCVSWEDVADYAVHLGQGLFYEAKVQVASVQERLHFSWAVGALLPAVIPLGRWAVWRLTLTRCCWEANRSLLAYLLHRDGASALHSLAFSLLKGTPHLGFSFLVFVIHSCLLWILRSCYKFFLEQILHK